MARVTPTTNDDAPAAAPAADARRWVAIEKDKEEESAIRQRAISGGFIDGERVEPPEAFSSREEWWELAMHNGALENKVLTGDFSGLDISLGWTSEVQRSRM